jgi:tetratricopeptide (TPR) repeat protein
LPNGASASEPAPRPNIAQRRRLTPPEVLRVAQTLHGEQRLEEAEKAYRYVVQHAAADAGGLSGLGVLLLQLGRLQEAEDWLRRALAIDPDAAEIRNNLCMALAARNRLDEAIAEYASAVEIDPNHVAARNNLGAALHARGRAAQALPHFEAAVGLAPNLAEPHNNLGNALAALGRPAQALAGYERALALKPDFVEARYNYGLALATLNRAEDAVEQLQRALTIAPDHGRAHAALGRAFAALQRFEEAVAHLERSLAIGPVSAELHNDLGAYLVAVKRNDDAVAQFRQACSLSADFAFAHNNLGNALVALGKHEEAVASYRAAFAINPAFAEAYANMGSALAELHHPEDALPFFERALALNPHLAETHNNRGQAFVALGHLPDARDAFIRAIALEPGRAEYYHGLAGCTRLAEDDPHFRAMLALAENLSSLDETEQTQLHFALAKSYENQSRHEQAFSHFSAGNASRRRRMEYDEAAVLERVRRFESAFDPEMMRRAPRRGELPDVPIFIVGMPRSGSTLVEQILASHPSVFGGGELMHFAEEAAGLEREDRAALRDIVASMSDDDFAALGVRYRQKLRAPAPEAPRITDKLPSNCHYLGLIRMALPDACVIHTRRDPVDTCLSCFAQTFAAGLAFSNDLGDLGRYYRNYAEMMKHWRRVLPEDAMLEVQYEDLVADFEPQVRRILDYCGLEWSERCLEFHETRRPVITASAAQVRQPIYQRSSGRARGYGRLLQPLFDALGDELMSARPRRAASRDPSVA